MIDQPMDMSTDADWEEWGRRDPYFGVITDPRFRRSVLTEDSRKSFFLDGESHVKWTMAVIHRYIDPGFAPKTVLDFGCGVGRMLVPLAAIADDVVGLDVAPSMLLEAQRNCDERQIHNVRLLPSDDELSALTGTFDLIHSFIVFQHIPAQRGKAIFERLLRHLRPGGVGAIHLTYAKARFAATHGRAPLAPPAAPAPLTRTTAAQATLADPDPPMQMNSYDISEILFLMQVRGIERLHIQFTDHGGELGVYLFFATAGSVDTA